MSKQTQCKSKFSSIKIKLEPSTNHQQASRSVSTQQQSVYHAFVAAIARSQQNYTWNSLLSKAEVMRFWSSCTLDLLAWSIVLFKYLRVSRELLFLQCWSRFCLSAIAAASSRAFVVLTWIALHFLLNSNIVVSEVCKTLPPCPPKTTQQRLSPCSWISTAQVVSPLPLDSKN